MIVQRYTYRVKKGCDKQVVELLKSLPEVFPGFPPHGARIYSPGDFSPWGVGIWEVDFENLAEYETATKELYANPRFPEWHAKWRELTESGGGAELWTVEYVT